MKIIQKRRRVVARTEYREERGYIGRYPTHFNILHLEIRFLGLLVWTRELDREEVSIHAKIAAGCLGDSGFTSKFAPFDSRGFQPA
ncbi:hypothetical protein PAPPERLAPAPP_03860 [Brevundimonas phage vB_BpoS-Papperlapapp]|nr:hypothetical protein PAPPERLAPAPP_03860 [Brevundimonas phage vB_BpoS-Papperlapapp]